MPQLRILIDRLPRCFWILVVLLLVFLLGVIDYETGDYLIIVFYMIPVVLATWFTGVRFGLAVAITCGFVRLLADYETYTVFTSANYINVAEDTFFLLIMGGLTATIHKMLKGNRAGLSDRDEKIKQED